MKKPRWIPSPRVLVTAAVALVLAGMAAAQTVERIRGPIAPGWVDSVTRADTDLVASQLDLDIALKRRQSLPKDVCWPCRVRTALKRAPMSSSGLRVLAMYEDDARHPEKAQILLDLATRLSRRDSIVQFWQIESASRSNNIPMLVEHYDQALSVRPVLGEILYPQIAARLTDARFRRQYAQLVGADRHWMDEFIVAAMADPKNLEPLARLFAEASPSGPVSDQTAEYERGLISLLAGAGHYRTAVQNARRLLENDALLSDMTFSERTINDEYSPLLWTFSENQELAGGLSAEGTLRIEALSAASGIAIYRVMVLDPGAYRFQVQVRPVEGSTQPRSAWEAHCLGDETPGLLQRVPVETRPSNVTLDFTVPSGCPAVRLSYSVFNEVGQSMAAINLSSPSLRRR